MNDSGDAGGNRGTDRPGHCPNCGRAVAVGARFCGSCGVSVLDLEAANATADLNLVVALVTLAWVLWMWFWLAEPFAAVGVDPVASLRTTLLYSGLWTVLMFPFIGLLALAAYLNWRAGGRIRYPQQPHNQAKPGVSIVLAATLNWLAESLLMLSEPGLEVSVGISWLAFTGMLALLCLAIVGSETYQNLKAPRIPRIMGMLGYMLPFPSAVVLVFVIIGADAPRRARFDLSEDELTRYVEEFERTDGESMSTIQMVGLYNLGVPGRRGDCVTLTTNSDLDYYAGFAYCTGPPPEKPNVNFDHLKGKWWTFEVFH